MDQENIKKEVVSGIKKNKKYILIAVGIIVLLIIVFSVNSFVGRKIGENRAERILENQLGGDVDIDSKNGSVSVKTENGGFTSGELTKWPTDMPSDVPVFTFGKLIMSGYNLPGGKGWQVVASNVAPKDFKDYHATLLASGWKDVSTVNTSINIAQMSKDSHDLMIMYTPTESNFILTVTKKP
jgi:hypothetical protein